MKKKIEGESKKKKSKLVCFLSICIFGVCISSIYYPMTLMLITTFNVALWCMYLDEKRYLIVLDDVWSIQVWNRLCCIFLSQTKAECSSLHATSRLLWMPMQSSIDSVPWGKNRVGSSFSRKLFQLEVEVQYHRLYVLQSWKMWERRLQGNAKACL